MYFKPVKKLKLEPNTVYRAKYTDDSDTHLRPEGALSLQMGEGALCQDGEGGYELVELFYFSEEIATANKKVRGWNFIRKVDGEELAPAYLRVAGKLNPELE